MLELRLLLRVLKTFEATYPDSVKIIVMFQNQRTPKRSYYKNRDEKSLVCRKKPKRSHRKWANSAICLYFLKCGDTNNTFKKNTARILVLVPKKTKKINYFDYTSVVH
jgi:hypothetical protein